MTENIPPNEDELWAKEQEATFDRQKKKRQGDRRLWVTIAGIALLVAIIYPTLIGIGPFGIKSFRADSLHLWVYNTTEQTVNVETSYKAPLAFDHRTEIAPMGIEHLFLKAGKRRLTIATRDGSDESTFQFANHSFITVGDNTCYAVFDMTEFYQEENSDDADFKLVERVPAGTRIYESKSDTFVFPRQSMPRRANGTIHWAEDFGCSLLAPEQEDTLIMRARVKLETREMSLIERMAEGE